MGRKAQAQKKELGERQASRARSKRASVPGGEGTRASRRRIGGVAGRRQASHRAVWQRERRLRAPTG